MNIEIIIIIIIGLVYYYCWIVYMDYVVPKASQKIPRVCRITFNSRPLRVRESSSSDYRGNRCKYLHVCPQFVVRPESSRLKFINGNDSRIVVEQIKAFYMFIVKSSNTANVLLVNESIPCYRLYYFEFVTYY